MPPSTKKGEEMTELLVFLLGMIFGGVVMLIFLCCFAINRNYDLDIDNADTNQVKEALLDEKQKC